MDENTKYGEKRRREIHLQEKGGLNHGMCGHNSAFLFARMGRSLISATDWL